MARRTKEEAQATRDLLLDTAECLFQHHGVSRTSLADIAAAAGVSRGAIYWHFVDKADLFSAMMRRVTLPMEEAAERGADPAPDDPLAEIRRRLLTPLHKIVNDPQVRRVFEIATHKVDCMDELSGVRTRHLNARNSCMRHVENGLVLAKRQGRLSTRMSARNMAIGLHALIDGLIQNWILDPAAFDLEKVGRQVIDAYLAGLAPEAIDVPAGVSASSRRSRQCSRTP
jgi:TetR/AcrR family transcriptional regulator, acrAB operon repressor